MAANNSEHSHFLPITLFFTATAPPTDVSVEVPGLRFSFGLQAKPNGRLNFTMDAVSSP